VAWGLSLANFSSISLSFAAESIGLAFPNGLDFAAGGAGRSEPDEAGAAPSAGAVRLANCNFGLSLGPPPSSRLGDRLSSDRLS